MTVAELIQLLRKAPQEAEATCAGLPVLGVTASDDDRAHAELVVAAPAAAPSA